ncbi:hypothetical protein [Streptomyces sp. NPDC094472]|uniref:hypothetical protein n=1 Tax=unclassified Streptomyces TaxID=2593676 RepID=UPI003318D2BE
MHMSWPHQPCRRRAPAAATGRVQGSTSTTTVQLGHPAMRDGDRAGLALPRSPSARIAVKREGGASRVVKVSGLTVDSNQHRATSS